MVFCPKCTHYSYKGYVYMLHNLLCVCDIYYYVVVCVYKLDQKLQKLRTKYLYLIFHKPAPSLVMVYKLTLLGGD